MFNQVETMEYVGHLSLSCNSILLRIIFYTTVRLSLFPVSLKFGRDKKLGKLSYNAQKFLVRICNIPVNYELGFMCEPFSTEFYVHVISVFLVLHLSWYQRPMISSYYLLCAKSHVILFVACC